MSTPQGTFFRPYRAEADLRYSVFGAVYIVPLLTQFCLHAFLLEKELKIKKIGLLVNRTKPDAIEFARDVVAYLTERGCEVKVEQEIAREIDCAKCSCPEEELGDTELLITLGGDGTILTASHIAAPKGVPVLGVHMGRFGFIAEANPDELLNRLDELMEGDLPVEERMMVQGQVIRAGETVFTAIGLNDIVLNKGARARMLRIQTAFGEEPFASYAADGVVVATPTGSSAYALSAGGPLVEPTVKALLVVPICAHTLAARPLLVPADEIISFTIESDGGEALFIADSYKVYPLTTGDRVVVRRADCSTKIVNLGRASFYRKIHQRLLWGERLNA